MPTVQWCDTYSGRERDFFIVELFLFNHSSRSTCLLNVNRRFNLNLQIVHVCWIFLTAFGCDTLQRLVEIFVFNIFNAKKLKKEKKRKKFAAKFYKKRFFKFAPKRWSSVLFPAKFGKSGSRLKVRPLIPKLSRSSIMITINLFLQNLAANFLLFSPFFGFLALKLLKMKILTSEIRLK